MVKTIRRWRHDRLYRTPTIQGRYARRHGDQWFVYDAHTGQPTGESYPLMPTI